MVLHFLVATMVISLVKGAKCNMMFYTHFQDVGWLFMIDFGIKKINLVAQAYTQYQVYLNFNTIRKSTTMLSRRVFELGASGCSIISSPSIAMNRIFEDSIISIANGQSAREWCLELQKDINKRTVLGERANEIVLSQHTWHHRLQQMNRDFELY